MSKKQTAHELLALLAVEGVTVIPFDYLVSLSVSDPLVLALSAALKDKHERQRYRDAFLASCIFNSMGGKTKPSDFLPKERATSEEEIKRNFAMYNAVIQARSGG